MGNCMSEPITTLEALLRGYSISHEDYYHSNLNTTIIGREALRRGLYLKGLHVNQYGITLLFNEFPFASLSAMPITGRVV
jgi:hypothetical protein